LLSALEDFDVMADDSASGVAALRQQAMALASVTGILVAAVRQAGRMTETLPAFGLTDAAAVRSEPARVEWGRFITAVRKVAAGAA
jgi:hypothetical protein